LTGLTAANALHDAFEPPAKPLHVQKYWPLVSVGVPASVPGLHAAAPVGADDTVVPCALPQTAVVGVIGAEHVGLFAPVLMPLQVQVQFHGALLAAAGVVELPVKHAAAPVGATLMATVVLFAVPQAPGTICGAEQFAGVGLFCPVHVQL
jgi:hypothetical protein